MSTDDIKLKLKHGAHVMMVSMMAGANIATIVLMLFTCLVTWLSPEVFPRLTQASLLFPIFLTINIMFIFAWLLVAWRWAFLPIIGMLLCGSYVYDYCPINLKEEGGKGDYTILSFNVANYVTDSTNNIYGDKSVEYIINSDADIICLQESAFGATHTKLTKAMKAKGYHIKDRSGMAIISKWPFVGKQVYSTSETYSNGSYAYLINLDGDTTLVINNHLESNAISPEERTEYNEAITSYDQHKLKHSGKILLSRIAGAASKRAIQTDSVCNLVERYNHYPIIVTGDMNETPISYTYRRLGKELKSAYRESGCGPGISFISKGFPVRIDHIFVSKNLQTHNTYIDRKIKSSDHLPILTRVSKSAK